MRKSFNRETGRRAEDLAVEMLKKKGYKILERNFSNRFGEIDIIAKEGNIFVFVEVKAKTGTGLGLPEEMVNKSKLQKVRNMGAFYMQDKKSPCRIDVVAVVLDRTGIPFRLTHYENVY